MATAPVTGSTPGLIRTWLLDHERIVIILILAGVFWWGYGKYADIRLQHDNAALAQQKLITDAQVKANQQLAQQVADDAAQMKALSDKVEAQNQQLANANIALATALSKQQKTDASLPPTDLALRWDQLVPSMPAGGVTVAQNGTMTVTQAGAVGTVQQLEKVPVLTTELANETTEKQNDDQLLVSANKSIFDLNNQVAGATKLDADHQQQCTEQIKVVKDEARKSKRRWFIIGYVAGFLSRQFIGKGL
jgi:cell division protein FtsB